MAFIIRLIAWIWLCAGLLAVIAVWLSLIGLLHVSGTGDLALALSFPWSQLIAFTRTSGQIAILFMLAGVIINWRILLALSRRIDSWEQDRS